MENSEPSHDNQLTKVEEILVEHYNSFLQGIHTLLIVASKLNLTPCCGMMFAMSAAFELSFHNRRTTLHHSYNHHLVYVICTALLVEWAGAGSPVGEEKRQTNSLENAGKCANGDGVERALLGNDLSDELQRESVLSLVNLRENLIRTAGAEEAKKIREPR